MDILKAHKKHNRMDPELARCSQTFEDKKKYQVQNPLNVRNGRLRPRPFLGRSARLAAETSRTTRLFLSNLSSPHLVLLFGSSFRSGAQLQCLFCLEFHFSIFRRNQGDSCPQTSFKKCAKVTLMQQQRTAKDSSRRCKMTRV